MAQNSILKTHEINDFLEQFFVQLRAFFVTLCVTTFSPTSIKNP